MKEDINKELIKWYQTRYLNPNCYSIMDRKPMEPKRVMNKVRIWDGTPTQKFFGKKKGKS